jgi:hypothetical protein
MKSISSWFLALWLWLKSKWQLVSQNPDDGGTYQDGSPTASASRADNFARTIAVLGLVLVIYQIYLQSQERMANDRAVLLTQQLEWADDIAKVMGDIEVNGEDAYREYIIDGNVEALEALWRPYKTHRDRRTLLVPGTFEGELTWQVVARRHFSSCVAGTNDRPLNAEQEERAMSGFQSALSANVGEYRKSVSEHKKFGYCFRDKLRLAKWRYIMDLRSTLGLETVDGIGRSDRGVRYEDNGGLERCKRGEDKGRLECLYIYD